MTSETGDSKYGYWGIGLGERQSFTKLYTRKYLKGRIKINNEVNNDSP